MLVFFAVQMIRLGVSTVVFLLASVLPSSAGKNENKAAAALIQRAKQTSEIRGNGSPGFVLRAEFKIVRDPNHQLTGTYKEVWSSRSLFRKEISAGNFHSTEVVNGKQRWELNSGSETPKDVALAVHTLAYPLSHLSVSFGGGPEKIVDRTSGSWSVHCILSHPEFGGREELCFEESTGYYVAFSAPFIAPGGRVSVSTCAFTDFKKIETKAFPTRSYCLEDGKEVFESRVIELSPEEQNDPSVFVAPAGAKESANCTGEVQAPAPTKSPEAERIGGGPVVLSLLVGTDGLPRDLKIVTSAGTEMDAAALQAVSRWRFKPARCDGQPMEVKINVIVSGRTPGQ